MHDTQNADIAKCEDNDWLSIDHDWVILSLKNFISNFIKVDYSIVKLLDFAHLNKGDGLAWASQSNVTAWPSIFIIPSNLDLGGNRGGLLPTGSKNEKGERFTT